MESHSAVLLIKLKRVARLLKFVQKKTDCSIEVEDRSCDKPATLHLQGDADAFRRLERFLKRFSHVRLALGVVAGFLLGIFFAYVLLPAGGAYLYSSSKGFLPPEYDALIKMKNINYQAIQIITHEQRPRNKRIRNISGKKHQLYEVNVDDSTTIQVVFDFSRKSLVKKIGQKKGTEILEKMVSKKMGETGIDSVTKYVAGMKGANISRNMASAVSRTTSAKIENSFRGQPVIKILATRDGTNYEFTNYIDFLDTYSREFTPEDTDDEEIKNGDYTREGRKYRTVSGEDRARYSEIVKSYVDSWFALRESHK